MQNGPGHVRATIDHIGAALPLIIIFLIVLSLPLAAARDLDLSQAQTTGWIIALYGLPGILSLALALHYRQPLLLTGNLFVIIYIASLGGEIGYAQLVGATIIAGIAVVLVSVLGITSQFARWIPAPIVFGLLAGAVVPFLTDIFNSLAEAPHIVAGTFLAYVLGRAILKDRVPAILPAFIVGHAIAWIQGSLGPIPADLSLQVPAITTPEFSLNALTTAVPVLIVLITLQANVPSIVFLREQSYATPERPINIVSGIASSVGSLLGPTGVSLSLPATSIAAGPDSGKRDLRYRTVLIVAGAALLTGLLAGVAAELPGMVPEPLLLTLAGLAVVNVFANAIQRVTRGPLRLGPLFAFVIALSDISFLGFGRYFWALVVGIGVSLLLEREALASMRE